MLWLICWWWGGSGGVGVDLIFSLFFCFSLIDMGFWFLCSVFDFKILLGFDFVLDF